MKITGAHTLPAAQDHVYNLLLNPVVLARCMPGCESLDPIAENEYAMRLKMVLASVSGLFDGRVRVADTNPPASFRLIVEGSGKIGFMKGDGLLNLSSVDTQTTVRFDGDIQIGGTIAAVGQRLVDATAKLLIKRFFERLSAEAA